jgi:hypothetical protein
MEKKVTKTATATKVAKAAVSQTTKETNSSNDFTPETNSFVVRNITPNILFISDLGITLGPLEVLDLTYEENTKVNASRDLRVAIKQGQLRRISSKEQDLIETMEVETEKARLIKNQKERRRQTVEIDDRQMEAEVLDLKAGDKGMADEEISTAGHINDPLTYATAYSVAVAESASRGEYLDAATFQNMVEKNPNIVEQYLSKSAGRGTTSGNTRRGKATVLVPGENGETRTQQLQMSNFARDHQLAGSAEFDLTTAEVGFGEEIDLADED